MPPRISRIPRTSWRRAAKCSAATPTPATYSALFDDVREAFNREFVSPAGRVGENTQTAYALALAFDLLPE